VTPGRFPARFAAALFVAALAGCMPAAGPPASAPAPTSQALPPRPDPPSTETVSGYPGDQCVALMNAGLLTGEDCLEPGI
jgi:hypothetical protein